MAVTTLSQLNDLYNKIYEPVQFVARELNLMSMLVLNRSARGFMSREISTRPSISAVSVNDGEDYNNPSTFGKSSVTTITPGEVIAQATLTDQDMDTDPDGALDQVIMELGAAVATKIDVDLMGLFDDFSTDKGDGAGSSATLSNIGAAISVLGNNKARQFGRPNVVLHPYHWHDIWVELGEPSTNVVASEAANQAIRDYYVSSLLGADWYTSANVPVDGEDDAISGVFVRDAIILDTRRSIRMEPERDASARSTEINVTAGYGYGINRDAFGVGFTADATEPA